MSITATPAKEPRLHIVKRDGLPWHRALLIRAAALLLSLCVCAVVIFALTGMNPLEVYKAYVSGAVGTNRRLWTTIRDSATLLLIALAITPAFKMRFWNIGAGGAGARGRPGDRGSHDLRRRCAADVAVCLCHAVASLLAGMIWGTFRPFLRRSTIRTRRSSP